MNDNLLILDLALRAELPLTLSLGKAVSETVVHIGHYICSDGKHYKTSDGYYYKCKSN